MAQVRVGDVEPLAAAGSPSGRWALYDDAQKKLTTVTAEDTHAVWLEGGLPRCRTVKIFGRLHTDFQSITCTWAAQRLPVCLVAQGVGWRKP